MYTQIECPHLKNLFFYHKTQLKTIVPLGVEVQVPLGGLRVKHILILNLL